MRPEVKKVTPWFDLHAAGKFLTVSSGQGGSTEKNGENGNMGLELRRSFTRREQPKARSKLDLRAREDTERICRIFSFLRRRLK